jgi:hypothetical protein
MVATPEQRKLQGESTTNVRQIKHCRRVDRKEIEQRQRLQQLHPVAACPHQVTQRVIWSDWPSSPSNHNPSHGQHT